MRIDVYDEYHNKTGKVISRGAVLKDSEFQLAACVIVKNKENKLLITQRHPRKQMGLYWEFPGGAVEVNELSSRAAIRELNEEVGIKVEMDKMKFVQTYCYKPLNLLVDVYSIEKEVEKESLVLQEDEVVDAYLASSEEIEQMNGEGLFTPFDYEIYKIICLKKEEENGYAL